MLCKSYIWVFLGVLGRFSVAFGQISPPGLDDTHTVAWGAFGISQQYLKSWQTTLYIGGARQSRPDTYVPTQRSAIVVINQETQYKFTDRWQLAFGTSYRTQNRYDDVPPYESKDPSMRNEVRYYGRLFYRTSISKVNMIYSFRPEYRTYYYHGEHWAPVPEELRFRLKIQAQVPLSESGQTQFILANEWLTITDHEKIPGEQPHWTHYEYTEDRISTYLRHNFAKSVIVDVGMMHQIKADGQYIMHFAFDVILLNVFK